MRSQFIVLAMNVRSELQNMDRQELQELYQRNASTDAIALLNLSGEINLGMAIRTASLFGLEKVYILGRRLYDRRGAVGMQNYIPIERIKASRGVQDAEMDVDRLIEILTELRRKYRLIFVEQPGQPINRVVDRLGPQPCLFIFGNEAAGIPKDVLSRFSDDLCIEIPQRGVGRSHNVAVAVGIVLWERYRAIQPN